MHLLTKQNKRFKTHNALLPPKPPFCGEFTTGLKKDFRPKTTLTLHIMQTPLDRHSSYRGHQSMARWLKVNLGGQLFLVDDPTIRQPGFNLPWLYWSKINHFQTNPGHCASCYKTLVLATSVSVANVKQCFISSTAARRQSWRGVTYHSFNWLKIPLCNGRCHMARNAHDNNNNNLLHSRCFCALQRPKLVARFIVERRRIISSQLCYGWSHCWDWTRNSWVFV